MDTDDAPQQPATLKLGGEPNIKVSKDLNHTAANRQTLTKVECP